MTTPSAPMTPPLLFDRSDRLLMEFTGPKAAESLTGLVTNDVLSLRGGDGQYACALTNKGKIIADVRILAVPGDDGVVGRLLVDANAASGVGFAAMIRKYVNPRTAKYTDLSQAISTLTLVGDGAMPLLRGLASEPERLEPVASGIRFTHREVVLSAGFALRVIAIPDLGEVPAFDVQVATEHVEGLQAVLTGAGAIPSTADAWHRLRVLAGWPEWGIDMDEGTLAQEANMDALQAISYRKGCYTGQETVARVHFRGHVNRTLRRVWFDDGALPTVGTVMSGVGSGDATGGSDTLVPVGDARSAVLVEPGRGAGIAMLRREVADGALLTWADATGATRTARVEGTAAD